MYTERESEDYKIITLNSVITRASAAKALSLPLSLITTILFISRAAGDEGKFFFFPERLYAHARQPLISRSLRTHITSERNFRFIVSRSLFLVRGLERDIRIYRRAAYDL